MFQVHIPGPRGLDFFLRSTAWTSEPERGTRYPTEGAARAALLKAKPYTKAAAYKLAEVIPAA